MRISVGSVLTYIQPNIRFSFNIILQPYVCFFSKRLPNGILIARITKLSTRQTAV